MAQVKFYSVDSLPAGASNASAAGNIYFVNGGELYKGASRFGANKVWTVPASGQDAPGYDFTSALSEAGVSGAIGGDILIGYGAAKVWDPATGTSGSWVDLGADNKATKATISSMISGLAQGASAAGNYIEYIEQDSSTGDVTAHAATFPSGTAAGNSGGIYVSVSYASGGLNNTIQVSADNLDVTSISATTGSFTNLTVTSTATFSATNISATALTVGGSTIEQIADSRISAVTTNAVTSTGTSLPTESAVYSFVTGKISDMGTVMHFVGAGTSAPSEPAQGDVYVYTGAATDGTGHTVGQEVVYTGSEWEVIGDQNTYATTAYVNGQLASKAQIGNDNASAYGFGATVTLYSNQGPDFTIDATGVANTSALLITAANSSNADRLVTAKAVKGYVDAQVNAANWSDSATATLFSIAGVTSPSIIVGVDTSANDKVTLTATGFGTATTKNFTSQITSNSGVYGSNLPTEAAVAAFVAAQIGDLGTAASLAWTSGISANGNNLPTESAVATYVSAQVASLVSGLSSTVSDSDKGVFVEITQSDGKLNSATVTVTASATATYGETGASTVLATTSYVADYFNKNLVWLGASDTPIA